MKWFVARRALWTVLAVYLVLSMTFFALALTPDPNRQSSAFAAGFGALVEGENPNEAAREAIETYDDLRNRDRPLLVRYKDWMVGYSTGEWGYSFAYDRPVTEVLTRAVPITLMYLIPGVLLASLLSALAGVFAALNRGSIGDRALRAVMFVGVAIPSFYLAVLWTRENPAFWPTTEITWRQALLTPEALGSFVGPALIVGLNLFAVQVWVVRSEAMELVPAEFVKTLRSNGARDRTVARHILRNAASPLLALFVSEVLVVLYVTIFVVEIIFGMPGFGRAGYIGFQQRDFGLIMAAILLPTIVGLVSNLLKDVLTVAFDPRVAAD